MATHTISDPLKRGQVAGTRASVVVCAYASLLALVLPAWLPQSPLLHPGSSFSYVANAVAIFIFSVLLVCAHEALSGFYDRRLNPDNGPGLDVTSALRWEVGLWVISGAFLALCIFQPF